MVFNFKIKGNLNTSFSSTNPFLALATNSFAYNITAGTNNGVISQANGSVSTVFGSNGFRNTFASGVLGPNIVLGQNTLTPNTVLDFSVPVELQTRTFGSLSIGLTASTRAGLGAAATADFASNNGLFLDSINVANDFDAVDISNVRVVFDSGSTFALSRSGVAASTQVPEPFTIVGTLVGGAAALRLRKRLKATNKL